MDAFSHEFARIEFVVIRGIRGGLYYLRPVAAQKIPEYK